MLCLPDSYENPIRWNALCLWLGLLMYMIILIMTSSTSLWPLLKKMCGRSKDSEFKYVFKALEIVIEWFRVLHVSFFIVLERNLRTLWSLCYMRVSYLLGQSFLVSWSNIKTTCICWLCFSIALLGTLWMFMPKDATQPNNLQAILSKATNLLLQISTQEYAIYILNTVV